MNLEIKIKDLSYDARDKISTFVNECEENHVPLNIHQLNIMTLLLDNNSTLTDYFNNIFFDCLDKGVPLNKYQLKSMDKVKSLYYDNQNNSTFQTITYFNNKKSESLKSA